MASPAIVPALRAALAAQAGMRVALLFGSHARGEAQATSDVDVAVIAPGVDLLELAARLGEAVEREVDVVDLREASIPLLDEIVRDGIVIHEANAGAAALWRSRTLAQLETDRPWYARMRDAWLARVAKDGV